MIRRAFLSLIAAVPFVRVRERRFDIRDVYSEDDVYTLLAIAYAAEEWSEGRCSDDGLRQTVSHCLSRL